MRQLISRLLIVALVAELMSCSPTKYVSDGEYLLQRATITSDDNSLDVSSLYPYLRQRPNTKWLSSLKVPLATYSLSGRDTTKWINRTLRKIGEAPVIYDTLQESASINDMKRALYNMGRLHSQVGVEHEIKGKRIRLNYIVSPGEQYFVSQYNTDIQDIGINRVLSGQLSHGSLIAVGKPFSIDALDDERKRITKILLDSGYYKFNKEFMYFDVDSIHGDNHVAVTMHLTPYKENSSAKEEPHPRYYIRNVKYSTVGGGRLRIRQSVLRDNTSIKEGKPFSVTDLQNTYNNFSRLGALSMTNIRLNEVDSTDNPFRMLDCDILMQRSKRHSISFQPEGTNTAGNLGAAASLIYENRNPLCGSELLSIELRGAFEAITGLEGYNNENYEEFGVQTRLTLPRMMMPFLNESFRHRYGTQTEISLSYNLQNRPEFHRRLLTADLRYKWSNPAKHSTFRLDLLDLNYIHMPWISAKFKADYLDNDDSRNAILKYNYDDIFVMKIGFGVTYSYRQTAFKTNIETAGNLLRLSSTLFGASRSSEGSYTLFNIAYAQYVKADFDFTHIVPITYSGSLAFHALLGVAYPYGNSNMLPFEKRYFAGGANSVRGWNVRELGPGGFRGRDGRIDFINHSGDIKLDISMELRNKLFWKFRSALFVDAGNIWTIKRYVDQPDGEFSFSKFYKQIAASYGLGLRLDLDYFVVRFDFAMKAVNPAYTTSKEHFPIFHPRMSRDLAFHFAVGMPF